LCRNRDHIPSGLLKLKYDASSPSLVGTQERFMSLVEDMQKVYLVFDALDECEEKERVAILRFITGIVTQPISCQIKVFVTSRREMDIQKAFEDKCIPTIQIRAENVAADIETFARSQVETLWSGRDGRTLYITSDKLTEKVI
jgi:ankyrin repeat domain-containing protein 50